MPLSTSLRKLLCCTAGVREEDETAAPARRALPEPVQAGPAAARARPAQAGQPYRDFAEGEAARLRRELETHGSRDEPGRQGTGAAALPEPSRSPGSMPEPGPGPALSREHMAVIAMQTRLMERGLITPPYSRLAACPGHVEALVQLAYDAGWLDRETPAPPQHPGPASSMEAVVDGMLYVLRASLGTLALGLGGRGSGRR